MYSPRLHIYCADKGHAPTLHSFGGLLKGVFAVVMDFIESVTKLDPRSSHNNPEKWSSQLTEFVSPFHATGYVYGDL